VALMTELIDPQPGQRCSGGQRLRLRPRFGELVSEVYGIEIARAARAGLPTLRELGYANVTVKAGDGWHGWPEYAPFDGILVTAAATAVPEPLRQQLRVGGRLVLPWNGAGRQN
jgi:protein-L-isoaspartate(D-aspartate) O-methyltransferase